MSKLANFKALVAWREDLIEMLVAEQHRLEHAPKRLHREINGHIDYLRKRIKHLDDDIDRTIRGSELWWEKAKILTSVPGVRPVLCAALLARLPELGRLNRAQAAKLVSPLCATSVCSSKVQLSMACRRTTSTIWRVSIWRQTSARPSIDCRVSTHSSTASKRNIFSADLKVENAGRKASLLWANFSETNVKQDREFESPLLHHPVVRFRHRSENRRKSPHVRGIIVLKRARRTAAATLWAEFQPKLSGRDFGWSTSTTSGTLETRGRVLPLKGQPLGAALTK
jgi:hypothetical protein